MMSKVRISSEANQYFTSHFDEQLKLYEIVWHEASQDIKEKEYEQFFLRERDLLAKYNKINFVLVNLKNRLDTLPPDLQEWSTKHITPLFIAKSTELKVAIVRSQDFSTQFSIEQALEEDDLNEEEVKIQYFEEEEAAREWLLDTQS